MNFVADESLDAPIIAALREVKHDVLSISETSPRVADEVVLNISKEQNRILLTADKDFGELVFRLKLISSGIVLFRIPELTNDEKISLALQCIKDYENQLPSSFCVITHNKIRIISL